MFRVLTDPSLYHYIPDEIPQSIAALAKRYAFLERGAPADAREVWLNWVLRRADSGAYVGTLQATVTPDSHAYIGYVLGRDSWGQGLATEACGWLVDELQERFALKEILATVDVRNVRSVRVLERLGFRCAATEPVGASRRKNVRLPVPVRLRCRRLTATPRRDIPCARY